MKFWTRFFIFFLIYSCGENNSQLQKINSENDSLKIDTIDQILKYSYFYPNGKLKLVSKYNRQFGFKCDTESFYFPNGNLSSFSFYVNGLMDGDEYFYSESGLVEKYLFNFSDTSLFEVNYSANGEFENLSGFPFRVAIGQERNRNDSIFVIVYAARVPYSQITFKVTEKGYTLLEYNEGKFPIKAYLPKLEVGKHVLNLSYILKFKNSINIDTFKQEIRYYVTSP